MAAPTANGHAPEQYDIIIVGAGTAGCVLANRLSEDPHLPVLVLEAGEDRNRDARVYTPALNAEMLGNPTFDWQYVSEPQQGINGRSMKHPRGRVLGGSSAINSYAFIYPSAAGLDAWADLGNAGWDWEGMRAYFRKFQTVCAPSPKVRETLSLFHNDDSIRDTHGPVQASVPVIAQPMQKVWVETFRTLGLENEAEALDGYALGGHISTCHIDEKTRERSHAGVAYFEPVKDRANLRLVTGATVQRLVFDGGAASGEKAAGATAVEYVKDGTLHTVQVRKEVLLAAGAFASPQLLELSGIGNPSILSKHDINVVHPNAGVGENLQDHIRPGLSFEAVEGAQGPDMLPVAEARRLYEESRSGPWAGLACYSFAYMPLVPFLPDGEREHLSEILDKRLSDPDLTPFERKHNDFIRRMIESPSEATATAFSAGKPAVPDATGRKWITLFAMLSHPFSRGSVHIASADAFAKPVLDLGYYTHPLDLEIHARHLCALQQLARTEPLASKIKKGGARFADGYGWIDAGAGEGVDQG